jgi:hypothetical protein
MNYDFDKDDEIPDVADSIHEEKDPDVKLGKRIAREKQYHALVGTVSAVPLDDDVVTTAPDNFTSQAEAILDREFTGKGKGQLAAIISEIEKPLPINVAPKEAKEQRNTAFTNAMQEWDTKLKQDEGMRVASGFKPKGKLAQTPGENSSKAEPWYIKEGIERGYIKGNKSRLNETLYQFFNDFNGVVDAFGIRAANDESSLDHAIQRDNDRKVIFGDMTYDRKQRATLREDGQAEIASESRVRVRTASEEGYDKAVRVITAPGAVQNAGYNPARGDLLLPERITDSKHRAEEVAVFVGPLLPELRKAVFQNATAKEIGESLGFAGPQASAVGNAMLQRALEAASDAYDRIRKRERKKLTYSEWLDGQPDGMPIPARKAKRSFEAANAANNKPANDNKPKEVIGARRWRVAA